MGVDLTTTLGSISLKHPVMLSSGPKGGRKGRSMKKFAEEGWAMCVAKTISKEPSKGWPKPQIVDFSPHYMINAMGGPGPGYLAFAEEVRIAKESEIPIFVSIAATSPDDFIIIAKHLIEAGADGIEMNASCPHTPGRARWSSAYDQLENLVRSVKQEIDRPVWVKLPSTRIVDIPKLAEAAAKGGADCLVPCNTVPAAAIDINTGKPVLGNPHGIGGLSGKAIKPIGVRAILDTSRVVDIPVIGGGGIETGEDVIEYLMAGASAVQLHTLAMRKGEGVINDILESIKLFMKKNGFSSLKEIIGMTHQYVPKLPFSYIEGL